MEEPDTFVEELVYALHQASGGLICNPLCTFVSLCFCLLDEIQGKRHLTA